MYTSYLADKANFSFDFGSVMLILRRFFFATLRRFWSLNDGNQLPGCRLFFPLWYVLCIRVSHKMTFREIPTRTKRPNKSYWMNIPKILNIMTYTSMSNLVPKQSTWEGNTSTPRSERLSDALHRMTGHPKRAALVNEGDSEWVVLSEGEGDL